MTRQSISLTAPNNDWLNSKVESEEYVSKSEVVNDLIRRAREKQDEIEWVRAKLIEAELSGFVDKTPEKILGDIKEKARLNGEL